MSNKKKYLIITIIFIFILVLFLLLVNKKENKKTEKEINKMISYTLDGKKLKEKPTKENGYIANKITCENKTNIIWDNTNWEVELLDIINEDICTIDFTKEVSTQGLRVTVNTNNESGIDSLSKTTIAGGKVMFYIKSGNEITSLTGCTGTIKNDQIEISNITSNQTCNINITESFYNKLLSDNPTILERTNFDSAFTEENTGTLYKASGNETEDGSDVYYFAGNAKNNWVKFGKDQNDADLYWRIIRTNEDESVRLLYIGPDPATESAFISIDGKYMSGGSDTTGCYNCTNYNNTMYVGYMYGSTGSLENNRLNTTSAPIKQVTDLWYSKTLNVKTDASGNTYDTYISKTAIYCNDRSTNSYNENKDIFYGAENRLAYAHNPSYKCGVDENKNLYNTADVRDKFSVSTSRGGNGQLEYPIAQITADEVSYAGGLYSESAKAWYYYNSENGSATGSKYWWTMTPMKSNISGIADVFIVYGSGYSGNLANIGVYNTVPGIRPVISLKSCTQISGGNGSSSNPYEVSINNTCISKEN